METTQTLLFPRGNNSTLLYILEICLKHCVHRAQQTNHFTFAQQLYSSSSSDSASRLIKSLFNNLG
jgi:hypothetical protein